MTAVVVSCRPASERSAPTDSVIGRACSGFSTIGASVPS
jgi:hypothetical protein